MRIPREVQESAHWNQWATVPVDSYNSDTERNNYLAPERTVELVLPYLIQGETVLDLGAGTGLVGKLLAKQGFEVDGIDFSKGMLDAISPDIYRRLMQLDLRGNDLKDTVSERYRNLVSVGVYGDYIETKHLKKALQLAKDQATVVIAGHNNKMDRLKGILERQRFKIKEDKI